MRIYKSYQSWTDCEIILKKHFSKYDIQALSHAFKVAQKFHGDQKRVNGEFLYQHLLEVLEILIQVPKVRDIEVLQAALLHDLLEDTCATTNELEYFGSNVKDMVIRLTKRRCSSSLTKQVEKQRYLLTFNNAPLDVVKIKLADRYSNVQALKIDPIFDRQKSYYRQTVEYIFPLLEKVPSFIPIFNEWKNEYQYLESDKSSEVI